MNGDFKQRVAKDGDSIKVYKDYTIDFMITPNLDWPDTMMVRYRDAIYAGKLFQHGTNYDDYFNKHFGHFSDFVLTAMERIEKLGIDRIFPSVGDEPVDVYKRQATTLDEFKEAFSEAVALNKPVVIDLSLIHI